MKQVFRYKLHPTIKQQKMLSNHFGCVRFIYNWGLDKKINLYKLEKKSLSYVNLAKELTNLKKLDEYSWLNDVANVCLQQSLRCLDSSFNNFFRGIKNGKSVGFPKFKSKRRRNDSCKFINAIHIDFDKWKIKVPKICWIKLCKNKTFDLSKNKVGTITISKDNYNEYWVSMNIDNFEDVPDKVKIENNEKTIGIDLGLKDFAILSNGIKIGNPKFLENQEKRLKRLNKLHSKTIKNSKNRERLRFKLAKYYRKIHNKQNDFIHKFTTFMINEYDTICLEDLNVNGMLKNHCLAKGISGVAWSECIRQLKYKAYWFGKNILFIDRFDPSSKTCNCCGYINKELKLSDRSWNCPNCGNTLDRDINAAINIKNFALAKV
jgi:putative transposase